MTENYAAIEKRLDMLSNKILEIDTKVQVMERKLMVLESKAEPVMGLQCQIESIRNDIYNLKNRRF